VFIRAQFDSQVLCAYVVDRLVLVATLSAQLYAYDSSDWYGPRSFVRKWIEGKLLIAMITSVLSHLFSLFLSAAAAVEWNGTHAVCKASSQGPPVSAVLRCCWQVHGLSTVRPAQLWLFNKFSAVYKYSDLLTYLITSTNRFRVDFRSTAIQPFDDLRYKRRLACVWAALRPK